MTRRHRRGEPAKGSPAQSSPPRGRSQVRSPRARGAPSPKTRALAFLATPSPTVPAPRPALALAYEDAAAAAALTEALDDAFYESETERNEDPRLLPAIATEIEAYDDPKRISPGYSTSEGEDELGRLGCGTLSPYSTSEDEDHAAPLRGRGGPLPSYRPSKLTRRSKALGARRRARKTVGFASTPLSVAILTPVHVKPRRVAFVPAAPVEVIDFSPAEVLPPRRRRGPLLLVLAVLLALLGGHRASPTVAPMSHRRPPPLVRSLTTPLRPAAARLARVPVPTPTAAGTAMEPHNVPKVEKLVPLVVCAAATGALTATGAPFAVIIVVGVAPRAFRALIVALR